jgi:hypothetical protein
MEEREQHRGHADSDRERVRRTEGSGAGDAAGAAAGAPGWRGAVAGRSVGGHATVSWSDVSRSCVSRTRKNEGVSGGPAQAHAGRAVERRATTEPGADPTLAEANEKLRDASGIDKPAETQRNAERKRQPRIAPAASAASASHRQSDLSAGGRAPVSEVWRRAGVHRPRCHGSDRAGTGAGGRPSGSPGEACLPGLRRRGWSVRRWATRWSGVVL